MPQILSSDGDKTRLHSVTTLKSNFVECSRGRGAGRGTFLFGVRPWNEGRERRAGERCEINVVKNAL